MIPARGCRAGSLLSNLRGINLMKFDHHIHTCRHSPDSEIDPLELVDFAREIGLDGVVITEHDYQWRSKELADLAERAAPLRVFSGAEISAQRDIFWSSGFLRSVKSGRGSRSDELLQIVQRHEAAIVAAHPFRWNQPFDEIVAEHGPVFDALELVSNNVTRETRMRTEALLRRHAMGSTGSSDAHELDVVGCYYTEFDRPILSMGDFVAGIKGRRGGRAPPPLQAGRWLEGANWILAGAVALRNDRHGRSSPISRRAAKLERACAARPGIRDEPAR